MNLALTETAMLAVVDNCPHNVKTGVYILSQTLVGVDDQSLVKERVLLLIEDYRTNGTTEEGERPKNNERLSERQACLALGIDPSYPKKLRDDPTRFIGSEVLAKIKKKTGIQTPFFHDATLGTRPDYRRFMPGVRTERDDEKSPYPEFERYISDLGLEGTPYANEIRGIRYLRGADQATYEVAKGIHRGASARDAGRALEAAGAIDDRSKPKPGKPTAPKARR